MTCCSPFGGHVVPTDNAQTQIDLLLDMVKVLALLTVDSRLMADPTFAERVLALQAIFDQAKAARPPHVNCSRCGAPVPR